MYHAAEHVVNFPELRAIGSHVPSSSLNFFIEQVLTLAETTVCVH